MRRVDRRERRGQDRLLCVQLALGQATRSRHVQEANRQLLPVQLWRSEEITTVFDVSIFAYLFY